MLALLLQVFIAAFSSFLLVGLVNLYDPGQAEAEIDSPIAYVGPGPFAEYLQNASDLRVVVAEQQRAHDLFHEGRVDAVVEELYETRDGIRTINMLLPEGELRTTLLVTLVKEHLKEYERLLREEREQEIQATVVYVQGARDASPYFAFAYALLVPVLMIVPAFLSGAIAADAITQELQTRTIELLKASPAGGRGIFLGKVIAPIVLAPLQGALWVVLFALNGITVHHAVPLLLHVTSITCLLVAAAVFFGLTLRKQGDAQVAYSLLVLLLFGASYLLPQPTLATMARLAVGSLTSLEWTAILGTGAAAAAVLAAASLAAPRLLQRVP